MKTGSSGTNTTTVVVLNEYAPCYELRAQPQEIKKEKPKKKVAWSEDVVDNENLEKKSSKVCCIYHPPRFGLDDTSSESESSDEDKNAYERIPKKKKRKGVHHNCTHAAGEHNHQH